MLRGETRQDDLGCLEREARRRSVCLVHQQRNRPFPQLSGWGPRIGSGQWSEARQHPWEGKLPGQFPRQFPQGRNQEALRALPGREEAGPHTLSTASSHWSPGGGPGLPTTVRRKDQALECADLCLLQGSRAGTHSFQHRSPAEGKGRPRRSVHFP